MKINDIFTKLPKFDPLPPLALITFGAAVGATTERLLTFRHQRDPKASVLDKDELAKQRVSEATLLISPSDVLSLKRQGLIKAKGEEIENSAGDSYTYSFRSSDNKTIYFLRGVLAGSARQTFLNDLSSAKISITAASELPHPLEKLNRQQDSGSGILSPLSTLLAAGATIYFVTKMLRGKGSDESITLSSLGNKPEERFTDVGGNQSVVAEMRLIVEEIVKARTGIGISHLPKGVMLSGDPGVGKTFHARVLAGEASCPFLYANASSLVTSPYVGGGARAIKEIFEQARAVRDADTKLLRSFPGASGEENGVVIIFLDEVDSIAASREGHDTGRYQEDTVNMLLAEMDNIDTGRNKNIVIVAATNMPDIIDPALLRPGRFKHRLHIQLPSTAADRLDILTKVSNRMCAIREVDPIDPGILNELALMSSGASPDVLRGVIETGIDYTVSANESKVTREVLYEALQIVLLGAKGEPSVNLERMKLVASHEHGHAIIALACDIFPLVVSMIPRGESLGRVILDSSKLTEAPAMRRDLLKALLINAGGRAGENQFLNGDGISPGVESDFNTMWEIANQYLRAGLSQGGYSEIPFSGPKGSGNDKIHKICNLAIDAANRILAEIPDDTFAQMVDDSIGRDEFIGDAAREFYIGHIGQATLEKLKGLAREYFSPANARFD